MTQNLEPPLCARDGCRGCSKCSAPPQIAKLRSEVAYYQDQLHEANERIRMMTSAATSAAASTVTAIERIQEMEKVVNAAIKFVETGEYHELHRVTGAWLKHKRSWS